MPARQVPVNEPGVEVVLHYTWDGGQCFRCARRDVPVAFVGRISPADSSAPYRLLACPSCLVLMEREAWAERGSPYAPGRLGSAG